MSIHKGTIAVIPATMDDLTELISKGQNLEEGELLVDFGLAAIYGIDPNTGNPITFTSGNTSINSTKHEVIVSLTSNEVDFPSMTDFVPTDDFYIVTLNTTVFIEGMHYQWVANGDHWKIVRLDGQDFDPDDQVTVYVISTSLGLGSIIGATVTYLDTLVEYTSGGAIVSMPIPGNFDKNRDSIELFTSKKSVIVKDTDYTVDVVGGTITFDTFQLDTAGDRAVARVWKMLRNSLLPAVNGKTVVERTVSPDALEEPYGRLLSRDYRMTNADFATLATSLLDGQPVTTTYTRPSDSTKFMEVTRALVNATTTTETRILYDTSEVALITEQKTMTYDGSGNLLTESEWVEI